MKNYKLTLLLIIIILSAGASYYFFFYQTASVNAQGGNTEFAYVGDELLDTTSMFTMIQVNMSEGVHDNGGPDTLNDLMKFNSDGSIPFPTEFRSGHVKKGKLNKYLTTTKDGYIIKFPRQTTITTPCYQDGKLFVSGGFGSKSYYAFNFTDGSLHWALELDDDGPSAAVTDDKQIIFNTESCTIFAIDHRTGEMNWSLWLGDPLMSTPTLSDGFVYTSYPAPQVQRDSTVIKKFKKNHPSHPFACFDAKDGDIVWQVWLDGDVMTTPVIHEKDIYLTTYPGSVYRIDKKTGRVLAAKHLQATSTPSIQEGKLLITRRTDEKDTIKESIAVLNRFNFKLLQSTKGKVAHYLDAKVQDSSQYKGLAMLMDAGNGFSAGAPESSGYKLAAKNIGYSNVSSLQAFQSSALMISGDLAYNLMGNVILCTNHKTGETEWEYEIKGDLNTIGGTLATTPILTKNHVVTITYHGEILILNKNTGKVEWSKKIPVPVRCAPIIVDKHIVIPTTQGTLYKINTGLEGLTDHHMLYGNPEHTSS